MKTVKNAFFLATVPLFLMAGFFSPAAGNDFKSKLKTGQSSQTSYSSTLFSKSQRREVIDSSAGYLPGGTTVSFRNNSTLLSQSASPYVLLHTGAREFDHNGNWKRHIANDPGGNIHMTFGIFDSIVGRNNTYVYQCYDPTTGALTFPIGSEPGAPPGWTIQSGGIDLTPVSRRAALVGRSNFGGAGNTGTGVLIDSGICLGMFSADTAAKSPSNPLDPDIHILNESTWVVFVAPFNLLHMSSVRTTNRGQTWTPETPVIQSSFLSIAAAGNRDSDGNPNNDTIWAAAPGCQDSGCFLDYEEVLVSRSTNGGQSWMIPAISPAGSFEYPAYHVMHTAGIDGMMIGDTFHIAWLDWADNPTQMPGGHVHHMTVNPNLSINGPLIAANIPLPFNIARDLSAATGGAAGQGGGWGIWQHPTMAYRSFPTPTFYILWAQPPDNGAGGYADSTRGTSGASVRTYGVNDIFRIASRNNGRSWDAAINETQTNHPGCLGPLANPPSPCEHEYYISAARNVDSVIWVLAQVQTLPGFQTLTTADQGFPGVINGQTQLTVIMQDQWRLYKIPAEGPCICVALACSASPFPENLHLIPGGSSMNVFVTINNTGIANLALDSIRYNGNLNDGFFQTTDNAVPGTPIPELGSYNFTVTLNPANVQSYQSGLRTGQMIAYVHSTEPESPVPNISCAINFSIYVVPSFCVFANDSIHSGTNASRLGTPGCIGCATPGASGFNDGMFYSATNDGYIFEGAPAIVNPAAQNGPKGLRYYFADQFLRCLTPMVTDSAPDGNGYYNISVRGIGTGLLDSQIVYEVMFEQSTHPAYSDFVAMTVRAMNISDADIPNVILGASIDADVSNYSCCCDPLPCPDESFNLSFDTSFTANSDSKVYTMMVEVGRDSIIMGNFGDPPYCFSRNQRYFGVITIPNKAVSASPVAPRGAVAFNNRHFLPNSVWQDSQFVNRMDAVGYHPTNNISDTGLTGMGQIYKTDSCPTGGPADLGFTIGAKKVALPKNNLVSSIASRYGLGALASSFDTLTLDGPAESFTVLFVAGIADLPLFIETCDSAIAWYNQNAGKQRGGDIGPFHRGDLDGNGILTSTDVVRATYSIFLGQHAISPLCTADLNLDGLLTSSDLVLLTNYVFLGILPTPAYPPWPELVTCFDQP